MTFKRAASAVAFILASVLLTGCSDGADYCKVIKKESDAFSGSNTNANLVAAKDAVDEVTDAAPEEIKDDWTVMGEFLTVLVDSLEKAGFDEAKLEKIAKDKGASLSAAETEKLGKAFVQAGSSINQKDLETSLKAIDTYTVDECDVELGLS